MNKNTLINLRVNDSLKQEFQAVVEREGFTMSEVLEASMRDVVKRNMVPINIRSKVSRKRLPPITIPFIKKCLDEALTQIRSEKIRSVSLFGSYSTGKATPSSDVDLFVDVDEGFTLFDLADLQIKLENSLGKKVDLVTDGSNASFFSVVQREKIQLYERAS